MPVLKCWAIKTKIRANSNSSQMRMRLLKSKQSKRLRRRLRSQMISNRIRMRLTKWLHRKMFSPRKLKLKRMLVRHLQPICLCLLRERTVYRYKVLFSIRVGADGWEMISREHRRIMRICRSKMKMTQQLLAISENSGRGRIEC